MQIRRLLHLFLLAPYVESCEPAVSTPPPTVSHEQCPTQNPATSSRRLSSVAYENALATLLPEWSTSTAPRFDTAYTTVVLEHIDQTANRFAEQAVRSPSLWNQCLPLERSERCGQRVLLRFAATAWRHTLTDEETHALTSFFVDETSRGSVEEALQTSLSAVLQAPEFLYVLEHGTTTEGSVRCLSSEELAARLALFLWEDLPDETLRRAAIDGALQTAQGLEAQTERMLNDPRARRMTEHFHSQWFRLSLLEQWSVSSRNFSEATAETKEELLQGLQAFFAWAFWEEGTLRALLTSNVGFVGPHTASLFGVPAPSAGLHRVALDPAQRAGILTQPALLSASSHETIHSPVRRGALVLDALLCAPLQAPPGVQQESPPASNDPRTTRQYWEQAHRSPTCASCHDRINSFGFSFEHYDALGRFRTNEGAFAIDASATISEVGTVRDGVELAHRLATHPKIAQCVVQRWFRFALGRSEQSEDSCALRSLTEQFVASGGNFRRLLHAIVQSHPFRTRSNF